jgi:hypothetical protein
MEQNAAIRRMQTSATGEIGSQYAGALILPDGTVTRDTRYLNKPPTRVTEIDAVLNAAGKRNGDGSVSGGYVLILNTDGVPVQYMGVSAVSAQTQADAAYNSLVTPAAQSAGISHKTAIELAARGVQTDGTPVDESYLQLIERWAAQERIPFVRPSQAVVDATNRPAPAAVVLGSGQGISAVQVAAPINYATPQPTTPMQTPTFTQGAILSEDFTPAPLRVATTPPVQEDILPVTWRSATPGTAPAQSPEQDASVVAADNRMKYAAMAAVAAVLLALALGKGK